MDEGAVSLAPPAPEAAGGAPDASVADAHAPVSGAAGQAAVPAAAPAQAIPAAGAPAAIDPASAAAPAAAPGDPPAAPAPAGPPPSPPRSPAAPADGPPANPTLEAARLAVAEEPLDALAYRLFTSVGNRPAALPEARQALQALQALHPPHLLQGLRDGGAAHWKAVARFERYIALLEQQQQQQPVQAQQQPPPAAQQPLPSGELVARHGALASPAAAVPAAAAAPPATEAAPQRELSLPELRQLFFDQPAEVPALRQRWHELDQLRGRMKFADGGALWGGLLAHMQRYIALLEAQQAQQAAVKQEQGQPGAAAPEQAAAGGEAAGAAEEPFVPRCSLCGKTAAEGGALQRMQVRGRAQGGPEHFCRVASRAPVCLPVLLLPRALFRHWRRIGIPSWGGTPRATPGRKAHAPLIVSSMPSLRPLPTWQVLNERDHVAVCGTCRQQRLGQLIPLTPMWMIDQVGRGRQLGVAAMGATALLVFVLALVAPCG